MVDVFAGCSSRDDAFQRSTCFGAGKGFRAKKLLRTPFRDQSLPPFRGFGELGVQKFGGFRVQRVVGVGMVATMPQKSIGQH